VTERALSTTQLDLRRITAPEVAVDRLFAAADVRQGHEDLRPLGEVAFSGRVQKQGGDRYRLTGRVLATLELDCGRCLEAFRLPLDVEVDLTYVPQPAASAAASEADADEVELGAEDLTTAYYQDEILDLAHMLREQFYLALPMRPLCREACRGLCPQCGTNLNVDTCACRAEWQDPRLAPLRSLLEKEDR
jgi:uncharacterized protein